MNVPGIEITLGDAKRIMPPLNAAAFKMFRKELTSLFENSGMPDMELVAKLAHAALQRNYPDITLEEVEKHVDFNNLVDVFEAVMNVSGLTIQAGKMQRRIREAINSAAGEPRHG